MRSLILVSLVLSGVDAARKHRGKTTLSSRSVDEVHQAGSRGVVDQLLIFGAPKVSGPALENPLTSDGCFPGHRIVTKTKKLLINEVDFVPTLLAAPYQHPKIDIAFVDQHNLTEHSCGWIDKAIEIPRDIHMRNLYVDRVAAYMPQFEDHVRVALDVSHTHDPVEAAAFVARFGYRLVGSSRDRDEASHLIQNPSTGNCFLTFEASDRLSDWLENIQIVLLPWCGLKQWVHTGFTIASAGIVQIPEFQEGVRPKLGHCRKVEVVGHSLGGAMATLFTACAHNTVEPGRPGYDVWSNYWWTKKETKIMDAIA